MENNPVEYDMSGPDVADYLLLRIVDLATSSGPTVATSAHSIIHSQRNSSRHSSVCSSWGPEPFHATPAVIEVVFSRFDVTVDSLGNFQERSFNAISRFGTRFNIANHIIHAAPFFSLLLGDLPLIWSRTAPRQISLITDQDDNDAIFCDMP
jgi:hypothetical protein